jgi:hypothetical protein
MQGPLEARLGGHRIAGLVDLSQPQP